MILVAKAAGLEVVAEGVENKEQANLLKLAGCTHLQGYLFGPPQELAQGDWHKTGLFESSCVRSGGKVRPFGGDGASRALTNVARIPSTDSTAF
jgi:hypothetical protein